MLRKHFLQWFNLVNSVQILCGLNFFVILDAWQVTGIMWMSTKLEDFLNINKLNLK